MAINIAVRNSLNGMTSEMNIKLITVLIIYHHPSPDHQGAWPMQYVVHVKCTICNPHDKIGINIPILQRSKLSLGLLM